MDDLQSVLMSLLERYNGAHWRANLTVSLNLLGALLLGFVIGYERSYHGRAAGMRTYGLVCMASAALTMVGGNPEFWFFNASGAAHAMADPTRVVQGIVTGIGFLCAGVIMRDGFNISGLTTSASLWVAAAIGIVWGVELYASAALLAFLSAACMMWASRLEAWLPSRPAVSVSVVFKPGFVPDELALRKFARSRGYEVAGGSFSVTFNAGHEEWRFVAVAYDARKGAPLTAMSADLARLDGIERYQLTHARN